MDIQMLSDTEMFWNILFVIFLSSWHWRDDFILLTDTRILSEKKVDTMAADDLALFFSWPSADIMSTVHDEEVFVVHDEGYQWPLPLKYW